MRSAKTPRAGEGEGGGRKGSIRHAIPDVWVHTQTKATLTKVLRMVGISSKGLHPGKNLAAIHLQSAVPFETTMPSVYYLYII